MPIGSGIFPIAAGQAQPLAVTVTSYSETARIELTNMLFLVFLQFEPTDLLCNGDSGNAMTLPEWSTTIVNFASWGLALVGIFLVLVVSFFGYASDKFSRRSNGEGGGKNAAYLGIVLMVGAGIVSQLPSISGDTYDGMEQCFALIEPVALALL